MKAARAAVALVVFAILWRCSTSSLRGTPFRLGIPLVASNDQSTDPVFGIWILDWDKSYAHLPSGSAELVFRQYRAINGGVHVSETRYALGGTQTVIEYETSDDGKEHPVYVSHGIRGRLEPTNETIAVRRLTARRAEGVSRVDHKVAFTFVRTVSRDGQTLSIDTLDVGSQGTRTGSRLVYRRLNESRNVRTLVSRALWRN